MIMDHFLYNVIRISAVRINYNISIWDLVISFAIEIFSLQINTRKHRLNSDSRIVEDLRIGYWKQSHNRKDPV